MISGRARGAPSTANRQTPLNKKTLAQAAAFLAIGDAGLAQILERNGPPPLWSRKPGFVTLIRIILEQQVSLASADAMYRRLLASLEPLSPETVISVGARGLRSLGLTRQKAGYFINLAKAVQTGDLDLARIARADDATAIEMLTSIKGIGPWTARIYLLMALRRPDVWPSGDIALAAAVGKLRGLPTRPGSAELSVLAEVWRPHRATAARMLWQFYLTGMQSLVQEASVDRKR